MLMQDHPSPEPPPSPTGASVVGLGIRGQGGVPPALLIGRPEAMPDQRTLVVLGSYRGGTSAFAGLARLMGIFMGRTLSRTNSEDLEFHTNDAADMGPLIQERNRAFDVWGFKHPGAVFHLDALRPHLRNPMYLVVFRDPLAIAQTELSFGNYHVREALWRAQRHVEALVQFVNRCTEPMMVVSYERAIQRPLAATRMMADFIGVEVAEGDLAGMSEFLSQRRYQGVQAFMEGAGLKAGLERERSLGVTEDGRPAVAISAELPFVFDGSMDLELIVPGRHLWGHEKGFIRLDLYPRVRPLVHERHFGFWDIPLKMIGQERTRAHLDLARGVLAVQTNGGEAGFVPVPGIRVPFDEPGNVVAHVSRWESVHGSPRMASVHSYPLLLDGSHADGLGPDTPMKQIHIPVTDVCNLGCPMCPRNADRYGSAGHMAEGVFEALLREVPKVPCVMVMALGEPLMYPGVVDVVRKCRERLPTSGEVGMTTNATLLDESMARNLIGAGLGFLYASLDGATKETYERYRAGAVFESTCANIKRFTHLVRESGSACRTMLNFVMMDGNVHEIPAMVRLATDLGAGNVTFSYEHGRRTDELNTFGEERLGILLAEASRLGAERGINVGAPPVARASVERCFCTERVLTSPGGGVYPCPMLQPGYHAEGVVMCFGNVLETPLSEIWDSEPYRAFRRSVLSGNFPEACARCGFKSYLTP